MFYNVGIGKPSRMTFNEDFKHCDIITYDGDLLLRLTWNHLGIESRRIKVTNLSRFIRALRSDRRLSALIVCDSSVRVASPWLPLRVQSCNEFCRFVSGLDIGFTWSPAHLFKKVLRYAGKRNFDVLCAWRRSNYVMGRRFGTESTIAGSGSPE